MTTETERTLQLGRLGRTIGLGGELLFHANGAAESALLEPGLQLEVEGHGTLTLRVVRRHNRGLAVQFEGVRRVERARELTNAVVSVDRRDLPADLVPTVFTDGLLGLPVLLDGVRLGTVARVAGASGHEFLTVEPGGQLLPLNAPYVAVHDDAIELLDPPDGLL